MLALTLLTALAAPLDTGAERVPEVTLTNGLVTGRLVLDAPLARVRAVLADSASVAAHSPDVLGATAALDGACDRVDLRVRGLFAPFTVTTARCQRADGWSERLVESSVFSVWQGDWTLTEVSGGTEVVYTIRTELDLPVPRSLVEHRTVRALEHNLAALADAVDAGSW